MTRMQFILKHLNKQKARLIFVLICVFFCSVFSLLTNLVFGFIIDQVVDGQPNTNILLKALEKMLGGMDNIRSHLYLIAIVLIVMYLVSSLMMYLRYRDQAIVANTLTENIRNHLYDHIQHLPYSFHVQTKTGDLIQRCTSDIDQIRRFFAGQIEEIVAIITAVTVAVSIMFSLNKTLAWYACISLPFLFVFSYVFFGRIQKQFKLSDEKESDLIVDVQESLQGVRVIKAFNREKYELDKFENLSDNYKNVTVHMLTSLGLNWGLSYLITSIGILSIIVLGIFFVRDGRIPLGTFLVFITYQSQILYRIRHLGRILSDFGKVTVSCSRLCEIINTPIEDLEDGMKPDLNGDIVFDHVGFHYADDKNTEVLNDIDLTIKKGETVAILGPTGSGKSSLIHLLAALYDCTTGEIRINGYPIQDIAKGHLRRNIGIVLQESFLFSKSIYDNLSISDPSIDKKAVERATKIASVHDVIQEFDKGYDTLVGEKGVTLSGGQKQRIAIARTIINNTPILVFDDSLSAVDTQTDANIRSALKTLGSSSTMIIITQRVNSAMDADKIVVIENGHISQCGTHDELIKLDGLYKRVSDIQNQRLKEGLNVE